MSVIRFQVFDANGNVVQGDGMLSSPEGTTAEQDAFDILNGAEPGWKVKLWKDVAAIGPLMSLGKPDAEVTS